MAGIAEAVISRKGDVPSEEERYLGAPSFGAAQVQRSGRSPW